MRFTQVDAFTSTPFAGNPAAVFVLDEPFAEERMQLIAREMNLSETAFVVRASDEDGGPVFDLRWFTPTHEIDLCGHATLATAHVLWQDGVLGRDQAARFDTKSGRLVCTTSEGATAIAMDFPANPPEDSPLPEALKEAFPALAWFGRGRGWYLARLADARMVRDLAPDMDVIMGLDEHGLIITAPGDADDVDVVSRVFVPQMGIPEDPVTGAAHCVIGPIWAEWLGVDEVRCEQASVRGGEMTVRVEGDRVALVGEAVTVLTGDLLV